ncbi:hypothetical protein [Streptomyces sp. NBC_01750]|uniref:hypothetical protein n=1 Tax=Streptomyces sp. NBC_01750 TaxID=2975928 RepID=UPI002DD7FB72|nr:hypothetical protein [Streptomyces sp. NBC_01750]WSD32198.1 hypothetical protein OG966_09950 [Streptomyces sp. NBC_01750]
MNGYEHYQRAEVLMAQATHTVRNSLNGMDMCLVSDEEANRLSAQAQVHATLALAAATADATNFKRDLYAGNGLESPEREARKRRAADKSASAAADFLPDGV